MSPTVSRLPYESTEEPSTIARCGLQFPARRFMPPQYSAAWAAVRHRLPASVTMEIRLPQAARIRFPASKILGMVSRKIPKQAKQTQMKNTLWNRFVVLSLAALALAGAVCASAQDTVDSVLRPPKGALLACSDVSPEKVFKVLAIFDEFVRSRGGFSDWQGKCYIDLYDI